MLSPQQTRLLLSLISSPGRKGWRAAAAAAATSRHCSSRLSTTVAAAAAFPEPAAGGKALIASRCTHGARGCCCCVCLQQPAAAADVLLLSRPDCLRPGGTCGSRRLTTAKQAVKEVAETPAAADGHVVAETSWTVEQLTSFNKNFDLPAGNAAAAAISNAAPAAAAASSSPTSAGTGPATTAAASRLSASRSPPLSAATPPISSSCAAPPIPPSVSAAPPFSSSSSAAAAPPIASRAATAVASAPAARPALHVAAAPAYVESAQPYKGKALPPLTNPTAEAAAAESQSAAGGFCGNDTETDFYALRSSAAASPLAGGAPPSPAAGGAAYHTPGCTYIPHSYWSPTVAAAPDAAAAGRGPESFPVTAPLPPPTATPPYNPYVTQQQQQHPANPHPSAAGATPPLYTSVPTPHQGGGAARPPPPPAAATASPYGEERFHSSSNSISNWGPLHASSYGSGGPHNAAPRWPQQQQQQQQPPLVDGFPPSSTPAAGGQQQQQLQRISSRQTGAGYVYGHQTAAGPPPHTYDAGEGWDTSRSSTGRGEPPLYYSPPYVSAAVPSPAAYSSADAAPASYPPASASSATGVAARAPQQSSRAAWWGERQREGSSSSGRRQQPLRGRREQQQQRLRQNNFAGSQLVDIEWQQEKLIPIRKNFYQETAAVAARSAEEVAAIFREHHMHVECYNSNSSSRAVEGIPKPVLSFEETGFPPAILEQLQRMQLQQPTAIQKIGWPVALSGRDMIGIAQTGSGKTLGFLLPALVHAAAQPPLQQGEGPIVLVLAPTRELAMQIRHECNRFTSGLASAAAGERQGGLAAEAATAGGKPGGLATDTAQAAEEEGGKHGGLAPDTAAAAEATAALSRSGERRQFFRTACIYGGVPRQGQAAELRRGAEIVIATPGRLLDFLDLGVTNLKRVSYVVLDEADRMMDMGFEPQVRKLFSQIRPDRQTLLWSATWPREVRDLAKAFCRTQVVKLQIGDAELQASTSIAQRVEVVSPGQLQQRLLEVLQQISGEKVLIFCETKRQCDQLCRELRYRQLRALAIHGDKEQRERDRILHDFRVGHCEILVATDVASRGLDIRDVRYVVNYEMPKNIESYIHRIGRTGRAGNKGTAISFFEYDYYQPEKVNMAKRLCDVMRAVGQDPPPELVKIAKS